MKLIIDEAARNAVSAYEIENGESLMSGSGGGNKFL
jgi:hypothetical protein